MKSRNDFDAGGSEVFTSARAKDQQK